VSLPAMTATVGLHKVSQLEEQSFPPQNFKPLGDFIKISQQRRRLSSCNFDENWWPSRGERCP